MADPAPRQQVPGHVGIIMDGNGRWAGNRGLSRQAGHRAGIESIHSSIEFCCQRQVARLTLFVFSSENWMRPQSEVRSLMSLFRQSLDSELAKLIENGINLRFVGDLARFSPQLRRRIERAEAATAGNDRLSLTLAFGYGGRWDLLQAARSLAREAGQKGLDPDEFDEHAFARHLSVGEDIDLLIRTGGELRLSNFMLWNLAYSELYFTDTLWPDFRVDEFAAALDFYGRRDRRFGRTNSSESPAPPSWRNWDSFGGQGRQES